MHQSRSKSSCVIDELVVFWLNEEQKEKYWKGEVNRDKGHVNFVGDGW